MVNTDPTPQKEHPFLETQVLAKQVYVKNTGVIRTFVVF